MSAFEAVALVLLCGLPIPSMAWLRWGRIDFPIYRGRSYPPWWSLLGDGLLWAGWLYAIAVVIGGYLLDPTNYI